VPKIGCHGNVPGGIGKEVQLDHIHANTYHLVKKIVKISPMGPENHSWDNSFPVKKIHKLKNI